jgi:hypothetical protein
MRAEGQKGRRAGGQEGRRAGGHEGGRDVLQQTGFRVVTASTSGLGEGTKAELQGVLGLALRGGRAAQPTPTTRGRAC